MAFFARPNLDNTQFKQIQGGEPLTLSGQTQIATTSGLTLIGDGGMYIPIIATGASNNFVLTYDGTEQVIKLKQSTASGGTTVFPYSGLTTCAVGGVDVNSCIYNCEVVDILKDILMPTVSPTLTNPSISSFTLYCGGTSIQLPTIFEAGHNVNVDGCVTFNQGCINPQYTAASDKRSGNVACYNYLAFGDVYTCQTVGLSNCYPFGVNQINLGSNGVYATVCYSGGTQPYDSAGNTYGTPLPTSATTNCSNGLPASVIVTGIYPWYWGKITCAAASGFGRPDAACIKYEMTFNTCGGDNSGNKVVNPSNGTLVLNFDSGDNDYIWFATPEASTIKTCWYVDALNKGNIGGGVSAGGNLFPAPETITDVCSVGSGSWNGQTYKIYISNHQSSSTSNMEIRNS